MKTNILLIDDETIFHFLNSKIITLTMGVDCSIQSATNGKEGLELLNKQLASGGPAPDAIFVDLDMPVMNGFGFVRAFRDLALPNRDKIMLAVLTSSYDEKEKSEAENLGVNHYLSKPLSEDHVRKILMA